jgi:hypothetical protein
MQVKAKTPDTLNVGDQIADIASRRKGNFSICPLALRFYGVIHMPGKKFGFLALTFILVSAVVVPTLLTDIASAERSVVNSLTVVQLFGNPSDYRWQGSWDPRFDSDWQTHYRNINARDCDVRCDRCAAGDFDRCDRCAVRDCDRCQRCPSVSDYRCDLFGCGWVRYYGCAACGIR